ncbi:MAG: DUF4402 domain-containing protein [Gammaproteobacteria bacterium]|nr:DUF4402 domain-containing protein [Gammaproteobacteria bacterium]
MPINPRLLAKNLSLVAFLSSMITSQAHAAAGGIPGPPPGKGPPANANQCKKNWTLTGAASPLAYGEFVVEAADTLAMNNTGGINAAATTHLFTTSPTSLFTVTLNNTDSACSTLGSTISAVVPSLTGAGTAMPLTLRVSEPTAPLSSAALTAPIVLPQVTLPFTMTFHGDLAANFPQAAGPYTSAFTIDFTDTVGTVLTVAATATATSVQPVILAQIAAMNFGAFAPDAAGDTVTLSNTNPTVRAIATGTPLGGTVSNGQFTMTGAAGRTVGITVADGATDLVNGASTLVFTPTAANLGTTHVITGVAASDTLYIGGTITIPAAAATGVYTSTTAYTVTVNYN